MRLRLPFVALAVAAPVLLTWSCVGEDPVSAPSGADASSEGGGSSSSSGAVADGSADTSDAPLPCPTPGPDFLEDATKVVATDDFACALRKGGDAVCWGANTAPYRALGNPPVPDVVPRPTRRDGIPDPIVDIGVGQGHGCALTTKGELWCWGSNIYGEGGVNLPAGPTPIDPPKRVTTPDGAAPLGGVTRVAMGQDHACAIASGKVYCWGRNFEAQSGLDPSTSVRITPNEVAISGTPLAIAAGNGASCAVLQRGADRVVSCWGSNGAGQLGSPSAPSKSATPIDVEGLATTAGEVVASQQSDFYCARSTSFKLACWGRNTDRGPLGAVGSDGGGVNGSATAVHPSLDETLRKVAAGGEQVCAIDAGGGLACVGANDVGQLGIGAPDSSPHVAPSRVKESATADLKDVVDVAIGGHRADGFACAIAAKRPECGGRVYCWGANGKGQLGNGATSATPSAFAGPVRSPGP